MMTLPAAFTQRMANHDFGGEVVDMAGVTLTSARWDSIKNLTLRNLTIAGGMTLTHCSGIALEGGEGGGITYVMGDNLTVHRRKIVGGGGVFAQRMNGLSITDCLFVDLTADAINYPGCRDVTIEWNALWGGLPPASAHPDFAQAWPLAGYPMDNIRVENNYVNGRCQGVFAGEAGAHISIARNLLKLPFQNAIYPSSGELATVDTNTVESWPDGYAQATILNPSGSEVFVGANTIGPWTDASGHTKSGKTIPATPAVSP